MSFEMNLWQVEDENLHRVRKVKLGSENRLENWLVEKPILLDPGILIIGRQVTTEFGGRIDLLGIDQSGDLVIIELKRDKTPREVVAQILDYASWVKDLSYDEINNVTHEYLDQNLAVAFSKRFDTPLPEKINNNHRLLIVASELDESSERIVRYLAEEHKININVAFFTFFEENGQEYLGRAWLKNPKLVQDAAESKTRGPWSGYWFVNVGESAHRNWDDNRKYDFIGAGQGEWFSSALERLAKGDEILTYMKGKGYVGYGVVTQEAVMIKDFLVEEEGKRLLDVDLEAPHADENSDDPELSEYVVGVDWIKTFPREEAKTFKGIFANPHITCKLRDQATVEFLEREFDINEAKIETA